MKANRVADLTFPLFFCSTVVCFETTNRPGKEMQKFKSMFPEQCVYAHTRYRSKIGVVPRLICIAIFLGFKKIAFVGMDGLPEKGIPHAFEENKVPQGSPNFKGAYDAFRRQYVLFWDYVLNTLVHDIEFVNLGEKEDSNMTAELSKKGFIL